MASRSRQLPMMQPQIILLKEGTDTSQGKPQLLANLNACMAVVDIVRTTLGPRGMDKLIVDSKGSVTISNDGATIMKLLDISHPAARILVDIARSQDAEVGDGTTSVVVLAGEVMKEVRTFVEDGVAPQVIAKHLRYAGNAAVEKIKELTLPVSKSDAEFRTTLENIAGTAMSSKLIHGHKEFFTKMVVDSVLHLDQDQLNERMIGIKKVAGGAMQDSLFIDGVAFKKTFAYAGFEQQPKTFTNPGILCLHVELELKAEKDNAEVRVENVADYQAIVDAEWQIILDKLAAIVDTGAKVVLSSLPIGDLATQYFADRDIFCAGRVTADDMARVVQAVGGSVQSTCTGLDAKKHLGTCEVFEERQIGGERYNLFRGCPKSRTCTLVLRGGADQFMEEVSRSLHDAIMVVKRTVRTNQVVIGGGATEMQLSYHLRKHAATLQGKQQLVVNALAKALEIIPRQISTNAGFDTTTLIAKLRKRHFEGHAHDGIDVEAGDVGDLAVKFVWEPALVKTNLINSAIEAVCLILGVDETITNPQSQAAAEAAGAYPGRGAPAGRGRGRA
ncbi:T-complex protein 1 subunit eta [Ramicandelaber brevisporus]|nr:T-complex protein 1 subunit eta [Ramicandelaber brevisporus]